MEKVEQTISPKPEGTKNRMTGKQTTIAFNNPQRIKETLGIYIYIYILASFCLVRQYNLRHGVSIHLLSYSAASSPLSLSPFTSGQQGPVRGHDAFSRAPCPAVKPGKCHTAHSDPTLGCTAFRVRSLSSTSLPHRGYVGGSPGSTCTVSGGLSSAPQAISLAPQNHQTWLRDSVRPASSQVQGRSVHLCIEQRCSCLACRNRGPAGEGCDRAGPCSRDEVSPYFIVPKKGGRLRLILDLRILNRALHKLPFRMLMQKRIFQCIRPFDWFAAIDLKDAYFHVSTQTVSPLCI